MLLYSFTANGIGSGSIKQGPRANKTGQPMNSIQPRIGCLLLTPEFCARAP